MLSSMDVLHVPSPQTGQSNGHIALVSNDVVQIWSPQVQAPWRQPHPQLLRMREVVDSKIYKLPPW